MPTGLFDIRTRSEVLKPAADWIAGPQAWRLEALNRWQRCVATAQIIDAMRAGQINLVDSVNTSRRVH